MMISSWNQSLFDSTSITEIQGGPKTLSTVFFQILPQDKCKKITETEVDENLKNFVHKSSFCTRPFSAKFFDHVSLKHKFYENKFIINVDLN